MARTNRDDFSTSTKDKAAKRSAYRCAFCGKPTIGPSFENNEAVSNTGVAAHICAAAPGGKRYDPILLDIGRFPNARLSFCSHESQ